MIYFSRWSAIKTLSTSCSSVHVWCNCWVCTSSFGYRGCDASCYICKDHISLWVLTESSAKCCPSEQPPSAMEETQANCIFTALSKCAWVHLWNPSCPWRKGWLCCLNGGLKARKTTATQYHNQWDPIKLSHARNPMRAKGRRRGSLVGGVLALKAQLLLWEGVRKGKRLSSSTSVHKNAPDN